MYNHLKETLLSKGIEATDLDILEVVYAYEKDKMEQLNQSTIREQFHIAKNIKIFDFDKARDIIIAHFSKKELGTRERKEATVTARRFFIFLAKNEATISLKALGFYLAGEGKKPYDHSTVLHHLNKFIDEYATDSKVRASFQFILKELNENNITTNYTEIEIEKIKILC